MIKPLIDVVCDGCQYVNECCSDKSIAMSKFSDDLNISNGVSDLSGNSQNNVQNNMSSNNHINNVDVNKIDKKVIAEVIAKSIIENFKSNI